MQHRKRIGPVIGPVVNWAGDVTFELSYRTVIQSMGDGTEIRESLRTEPRIRIEFTANYMGDDAEDFLAEVMRNYNAKWYFPLPFRKTKVEVALDGGSVVPWKLSCPDGVPFWLVEDTTIVLQTRKVREHARVIAVDLVENTISLAADYQTPISTAEIYASIPVVFEDTTSIEMLTSDVYSQRLAVLNVIGENTFEILPFAAEQTLDGVPVMNFRPNWATNPNIEFMPDFKKTDFGFGRRLRRLRQDFTVNTIKMGYTYFNLAKMEWYLSFVHHIKGRNLPFWYPEWGNLLDTSPAQPMATSLFYPTNKFLGRNYSGSKTHRNLYLEHANGEWVGSKITDFRAAMQPGYVQIAPPTPRAIPNFPLRTAAWLTLRRLASDEISFQLQTSQVGQLEMSMHLLPTREVQ